MKTKKRKNPYRSALKELLEYAKGNRGSREGNPYFKSEIKRAMRVLGEK
jgi:hypothetical protein